jgi:hypothetical protein
VRFLRTGALTALFELAGASATSSPVDRSVIDN